MCVMVFLFVRAVYSMVMKMIPVVLRRSITMKMGSMVIEIITWGEPNINETKYYIQ